MRATPFEGTIFVIDTDSYAGNFERQMCAYVTGQVGECGVGQEMAEKFNDECDVSFAGFVVSVPDEHGCWRPASIYPTPGFWNDGMGNEWADEDWGKPHTLEAYRKEVEEYEEEHSCILNPDLPEGPRRHPSYQSVAIFLDEKPKPETLELMMQRARAFPAVHAADAVWNSKFKILGFRLVDERIETTQLASFPASTDVVGA